MAIGTVHRQRILQANDHDDRLMAERMSVPAVGDNRSIDTSSPFYRDSRQTATNVALKPSFVVARTPCKPTERRRDRHERPVRDQGLYRPTRRDLRAQTSAEIRLTNLRARPTERRTFALRNGYNIR